MFTRAGMGGGGSGVQGWWGKASGDAKRGSSDETKGCSLQPWMKPRLPMNISVYNCTAR